LYDPRTISRVYSQILDNTNNRWDFYADPNSLVIPFTIDQLNRAILDAKNRGVRFRIVTDITKDNLAFFFFFLMKVAEIRHLAGIIGNFGVSDAEYISTSDRDPVPHTTRSDQEQKITSTTKTTESATLKHAVYSNVKEDIQQHQHIFEILWTNAIPVGERIREIEEGIERVETIALRDSA